MLVGGGPDGSALAVFGVDAFEVVGGGGGEFLPVTPLIRRQENGAGTADDPADFPCGSGTGKEIGGDTALLLLPGVTRIKTEFDFAMGPDAPGVRIGSNDDDAAAGKVVGRELGRTGVARRESDEEQDGGKYESAGLYHYEISFWYQRTKS